MRPGDRVTLAAVQAALPEALDLLAAEAGLGRPGQAAKPARPTPEWVAESVAKISNGSDVVGFDQFAEIVAQHCDMLALNNVYIAARRPSAEKVSRLPSGAASFPGQQHAANATQAAQAAEVEEFEAQIMSLVEQAFTWVAKEDDDVSASEAKTLLTLVFGWAKAPIPPDEWFKAVVEAYGGGPFDVDALCDVAVQHCEAEAAAIRAARAHGPVGAAPPTYAAAQRAAPTAQQAERAKLEAQLAKLEEERRREDEERRAKQEKKQAMSAADVRRQIEEIERDAKEVTRARLQAAEKGGNEEMAPTWKAPEAPSTAPASMAEELRRQIAEIERRQKDATLAKLRGQEEHGHTGAYSSQGPATPAKARAAEDLRLEIAAIERRAELAASAHASTPPEESSLRRRVAEIERQQKEAVAARLRGGHGAPMGARQDGPASAPQDFERRLAALGQPPETAPHTHNAFGGAPLSSATIPEAQPEVLRAPAAALQLPSSVFTRSAAPESHRTADGYPQAHGLTHHPDYDRNHRRPTLHDNAIATHVPDVALAAYTVHFRDSHETSVVSTPMETSPASATPVGGARAEAEPPQSWRANQLTASARSRARSDTAFSERTGVSEVWDGSCTPTGLDDPNISLDELPSVNDTKGPMSSGRAMVPTPSEVIRRKTTFADQDNLVEERTFISHVPSDGMTDPASARRVSSRGVDSDDEIWDPHNPTPGGTPMMREQTDEPPAFFGHASSANSGNSGRSGKFNSRRGSVPINSQVMTPTYSGKLRVFDTYDFLEEKGHGAFGQVMRVQHKTASFIRACKSVKLRSPQQRQLVETEMQLMRKLDHPNVVQIFEAFYDGDRSIYIIIELCSGGPFTERMKVSGQLLSDPQIASGMRDMLTALAYCHNRGVVHRDIKPDNLLYVDNSATSRLKVIDFGLSEFLSKLEQTEGNNMVRRKTSIFSRRSSSSAAASAPKVGTPHYMAPEIYREGSYPPKVDTFACGVVLAEALTGEHPFFILGKDNLDTIKQKILSGNSIDYNSKVWTRCSPQGRDLAQRLLEPDLQKRWDAQTALRHSWLAQVRKSHSEVWDVVFESLRAFGNYHVLKQAALRVLVRQLDATQLQDMIKQFEILDADGSGSISAEELETGAKRAGISFSRYEVQEILLVFDRMMGRQTLDSEVAYSDFLAALLPFHQVSPTKQQLEYVFRRFNGDSAEQYITRNSLQNALSSLAAKNMPAGVPMSNAGEDVSKQDLDFVFEELGGEHRGLISFQAFCSMFSRGYE